MYADACFVAGASVPARASLPPPDGKEAWVKIRACHHTHYVPVHNIAANPRTGNKRVSRCVRITTYITAVHNIAIDEKPVYGGDSRHR